MVCKQTLTNTNSNAIFDPDFKRIGGDGGNEVTLPQHVWTDSSCSSNALCPLGESRACQQDGYIKKKLQKRKKKDSDSNLILKVLKNKKGLFYNCERTAVWQLLGWLPGAQLGASSPAAVAPEAREEEETSAGPWRRGGGGGARGTNQDRKGWEWGERVAETICEIQDTAWQVSRRSWSCADGSIWNPPDKAGKHEALSSLLLLSNIVIMCTYAYQTLTKKNSQKGTHCLGKNIFSPTFMSWH